MAKTIIVAPWSKMKNCQDKIGSMKIFNLDCLAAIFAALRNDPAATPGEIAAIGAYPEEDIRLYIDELIRVGVLEEHGDV